MPSQTHLLNRQWLVRFSRSLCVCVSECSITSPLICLPVQGKFNASNYRGAVSGRIWSKDAVWQGSFFFNREVVCCCYCSSSQQRKKKPWEAWAAQTVKRETKMPVLLNDSALPLFSNPTEKISASLHSQNKWKSKPFSAITFPRNRACLI